MVSHTHYCAEIILSKMKAWRFTYIIYEKLQNKGILECCPSIFHVICATITGSLMIDQQKQFQFS